MVSADETAFATNILCCHAIRSVRQTAPPSDNRSNYEVCSVQDATAAADFQRRHIVCSARKTTAATNDTFRSVHETTTAETSRSLYTTRSACKTTTTNFKNYHTARPATTVRIRCSTNSRSAIIRCRASCQHLYICFNGYFLFHKVHIDNKHHYSSSMHPEIFT